MEQKMYSYRFQTPAATNRPGPYRRYRRHRRPDAHRRMDADWWDGIRLTVAFVIGFLALVALVESMCAACGCPWYL